MSGADLKKTLQEGGRIFGTMISINRSPRWIPILDDVGLDYVIIDTEHSPRSRGELGDYRPCSTPSVSFPSSASHSRLPLRNHGHRRRRPGHPGPVLRNRRPGARGRQGRQVPPPQGRRRRASPGIRPTAQRRQPRLPGKRNRNNICIIGIESQAAVDNLDAILDVPHIDAIFVGPNDMSISLGVPDDYDQEVYKSTVKGIIDKCESRGLPTLVHHQTPELSEYWIEQGARFVLHGTDRRALAEGFRTDFTRLRNKAASV